MQKQLDASAQRGTEATTVHENDQEILFCIKSIAEGGPLIKPGDLVSYELMQGTDGRRYAINVQVIHRGSSKRFPRS